MGADFKKDAAHGAHGEHAVHLASCYMGPLSHEADHNLLEALRTRAKEGTSFPHNARFGNAAIQGGAKGAIAAILDTDPANITLTNNTNDGLQIIKQGMSGKPNPTALLYGSEYLDVKTPFITRADIHSGWSTICVDGSRDSKNRPLGFDLVDFEQAIAKGNIDLVVVSHVQFTNGFTTDLDALSKVCRLHGVPLVVDTAQSFGALPLSPADLGVSAVVAPLWKWIGGLRGTAFLYTSPEFRESLAPARLSASALEIDDWLSDVATARLAKDGNKFVTSTLPTETWVATASMLEGVAKLGVGDIEKELRRLHALCREHLASPRISIYESPSPHLGSFLAFSLNDPYSGKEGQIVEAVRAADKPVDITSRGGFIRIAPHHFTSDESLRAACKAIVDAVNAL